MGADRAQERNVADRIERAAAEGAAEQQRRRERRPGDASAAASELRRPGRNAATITRRTPKRAAKRPTARFRNSIALPSEISAGRRELAMARDHHVERREGEELAPPGRAAEGDQPGEPQPGLGEEAADAGERVGGARRAGAIAGLSPSRSNQNVASSTRAAAALSPSAASAP